MAKVTVMVRFTSIPIKVAAPLSSETASMACPILVLLINVVSTTMITIQEIMVTMVTLEMESFPSASFKAGSFTTDSNCLEFDPKIKSATF